MNCETAKQFLLLLNYSELSLEEEDALEQHLSTCAECQAERVRLEKFEDVLAHGEPDMPAGLLARCRRDLVDVSPAHRRRAGSAL